jgi:FixJ family two-component response regulator
MLTLLYEEEPVSRPPDASHLLNVFVVGLCCPSWNVSDKSEAQDWRIVRFEGVSDFVATDHAGRVGVVVFDEDDDERLSSLLDHCRLAQGRLVPILASRSVDISRAVRFMRAGAFDVLRDPDDDNLYSSVRAAADRLKPAATPRRVALSSQADWAGLTRRQTEILGRILKGQPNKIIAADLGISQRTAENHRALIMKKMGASSISNLVQAALPLPVVPHEHPSFAAAK